MYKVFICVMNALLILKPEVAFANIIPLVTLRLTMQSVRHLLSNF